MNDQYRQNDGEQLSSKLHQLNSLIDKGNFSRSDLDEIYQAIKQVCESEALSKVDKTSKD